MLCSAFITYLGGTGEESRLKYTLKWLHIVAKVSKVNSFEFLSEFVSSNDKLIWKSWDLPNDDLSHENVAIIASLKGKVRRE